MTNYRASAESALQFLHMSNTVIPRHRLACPIILLLALPAFNLTGCGAYKQSCSSEYLATIRFEMTGDRDFNFESFEGAVQMLSKTSFLIHFDRGQIKRNVVASAVYDDCWKLVYAAGDGECITFDSTQLTDSEGIPGDKYEWSLVIGGKPSLAHALKGGGDGCYAIAVFRGFEPPDACLRIDRFSKVQYWALPDRQRFKLKFEIPDKTMSFPKGSGSVIGEYSESGLQSQSLR